jgi:hypothetical protein
MSSIIPTSGSAADARSNERLAPPDCDRSPQNLNQNGHNHTVDGFPKSAPFATSAPAYRLQLDDVPAVHDEICSRRWENLRLLRLRERRKGRFKGLDQYSSTRG